MAKVPSVQDKWVEHTIKVKVSSGDDISESTTNQNKDAEDQKKAFDEGFAAAKQKLDKIEDISDTRDNHLDLRAVKEERQRMEAAVKAGDYAKALTLLNSAVQKAAVFFPAPTQTKAPTPGLPLPKVPPRRPADKRSDQEITKTIEARTGKAFGVLMTELGHGPLTLSPYDLEETLYANGTLKRPILDNKPQVVMDEVLEQDQYNADRIRGVARIGTEANIAAKKEGGQKMALDRIQSNLMAAAGGIQKGSASAGLVKPVQPADNDPKASPRVGAKQPQVSPVVGGVGKQSTPATANTAPASVKSDTGTPAAATSATNSGTTGQQPVAQQQTKPNGPTPTTKPSKPATTTPAGATLPKAPTGSQLNTLPGMQRFLARLEKSRLSLDDLGVTPESLVDSMAKDPKALVAALDKKLDIRIQHDQETQAQRGVSGAAKVDAPNQVVDNEGKFDRKDMLGDTPGINSTTGRKVFERMQSEKNLKVEGQEVLVFDRHSGKWVSLKNCQMGHTLDAVKWWNETGHYYGMKSELVRKWMLDPANYEFEAKDGNMSRGAKVPDRYVGPHPDPITPGELSGEVKTR